MTMMLDGDIKQAMKQYDKTLKKCINSRICKDLLYQQWFSSYIILVMLHNNKLSKHLIYVQ